MNFYQGKILAEHFPFPAGPAAASSERLRTVCDEIARGDRQALSAARTGRRLPPRGQRQHGQGDPRRLDRQGRRPAAVRAGGLRRRGGPTRLRRGPGIGDAAGALPAGRRRAQRLRHRHGRRRPAPRRRRLPAVRGSVAGGTRGGVRRLDSRGARGSRCRGRGCGSHRGPPLLGPALSGAGRLPDDPRAPAGVSYAEGYAAEHKKLYGYVHEGRALEIVAARVEVVGRTAAAAASRPAARPPHAAEAERTVETWFGEPCPQPTQVFLRDGLRPGRPAFAVRPSSARPARRWSSIPAGKRRCSAAASCSC